MMKVSIEESNRRLLVLAEFLLRLPPENFHFDRWVGKDWMGAEDLSCGTTACALGWATTIPEFRKLGLRMYRLAGSSAGWPRVEGPGVGSFYCHYWRDPIEASKVIFGLTEAEHLFLFIPSEDFNEEHATAKEIAQKIRGFVYSRRARLEVDDADRNQ